MKFFDLLTLSTRMFTTRPMRTFLTILGVSVGIGAVLFLVSLGYGMQRVILSQITTADTLLSLDVAPASSGLITLTQGNIDKIKRIANVSEAVRIRSFSGQLSYNDLSSDTMVKVIDPAFFRLNGSSASAGSLFSSSKDPNIVITTATAKLFDIAPDELLGKQLSANIYVQSQSSAEDQEQVPETVTITFTKKFTVSGIIDDSTTSIAYLPLGVVQEIYSIPSYDMIKVKVQSQAAASGVREQIIGQGFVVTSISDVIDQANKIFSVLQVILGLFGLIALIVSAIGMFNTMTIALLERINEIGIMRSVGVTRGDIRKMFIVEAMTMGFLGGVGGVLLGFLGGFIANIGVNLLAKSLGGQSFNLFYQPPWFIVLIIVFSTLVGLLTGIFPSRRAANMDPLEALRYK